MRCSSTSQILLAAFVLSLPLFLPLAVLSHPVFHHKFNEIVDSNPCLGQCMDEAASHGKELHPLKTVNVTGYILNIDDTCERIKRGRECIDACNKNATSGDTASSANASHSNPFALEVMREACSEQSRAEVRKLEHCLTRDASSPKPALETCRDECGDHGVVHELAHNLTVGMDPKKLHEESEQRGNILIHTGVACATLKCSNRCVVKVLSSQCGAEEGAAMRSLMERVLAAQRRDLEKMQLVEMMSATMPIHCNFHYIPEVMFNETSDILAVSAIDAAQRQPTLQRQAEHHLLGHPTTSSGVKEGRTNGLNSAVSQLQASLLKKQLHLAQLQEALLEKKLKKADAELALIGKTTHMVNSEG